MRVLMLLLPSYFSWFSWLGWCWLGFCWFALGDEVHFDPLKEDEMRFYGSGKVNGGPNGGPSLQDLWGSLWPFQDVNSFAHLNHFKCLIEKDSKYDIGLIGVPFDTATSYRPGARFGPRAIRAASQRQTSLRGYNPRAHYNPYLSWAEIVDCGDIPVTPVDNALAFKQMTMAFEELVFRRSSSNETEAPPRYIALGGDHSIILPHLRALKQTYGPVNVVHFDAHLDTWAPDKYPSFWHSAQSEVNHGSMLWKAHKEGLTSEHNIHAGLRTKLSGIEDYVDDSSQNYTRISADDIWIKGADYVINTILQTVPHDTPTYLSVDIDVLDPAFASGTGTQEPGGWLPRELIYVLRGIEQLSIVGADIVEVAPAFDIAEVTATNGAQVAYEILTSMVQKGSLGHLVKDKNPTSFIKVANPDVDVPQDQDAKKLTDKKKKKNNNNNKKKKKKQQKKKEVDKGTMKQNPVEEAQQEHFQLNTPAT